MSFNDEALMRLRRLTPDERAAMRRILTGEADADLVSKGAVASEIRKLRLSKASLSSPEYQKALGDVQRAVYRLDTES